MGFLIPAVLEIRVQDPLQMCPSLLPATTTAPTPSFSTAQRSQHPPLPQPRHLVLLGVCNFFRLRRRGDTGDASSSSFRLSRRWQQGRRGDTGDTSSFGFCLSLVVGSKETFFLS
nr:hypothetical protein Itr_chr01CG04260 [Ipomoea trifida]